MFQLAMPGWTMVNLLMYFTSRKRRKVFSMPLVVFIVIVWISLTITNNRITMAIVRTSIKKVTKGNKP